MRWLPVVLILMSLLLLAGCGTTREVTPAITAAEAKRLLCASIDRIEFAYDPDRPEISDTPSTVAQIRRNNAARAAVCDSEASGAVNRPAESAPAAVADPSEDAR